MKYRIIARLFVLAFVVLPSRTPKASYQVPVGQTETDPDPYEQCGVLQFAWTDRGVLARSAQPLEGSLSCLHNDVGVDAIMNLRDEYPGYEEEAAVEGLGMSYQPLKIIDDRAPSPEQVSEFLSFVQTRRRAGMPVLSHCAGGAGRAGTMEGIYLLWKGWSTSDVFGRYIRFGAKIDCENGGNGQIQALHEIGVLLGRGDAWPEGKDYEGNSWEGCPRPAYMDGWNYADVVFPSAKTLYLPVILADDHDG